MKKKRWIDVLVLTFILIISGAVRIVYAMRYMNEVTVSERLIQRTWVTGSELLRNIEFSLDDLYTVCLAYTMQFFGNKAIVGVGVNIVLQLLSILFIYLCIRTVSDTVASVIPTVIISLLPVYVMMVGNINSVSLLITGVSLAILIILSLIRGIILLIFGKKTGKGYVEDEIEEEIPEDEIDYLSEEQLSEEDDYEEDMDDTEEEEYDEPVEYLEHIGQSWDNCSDNDSLSEGELGALLNEKENTLLQLKQLEEKYYEKESCREEQNATRDTVEEIPNAATADSIEEPLEEDSAGEECNEETEEVAASIEEEYSQPTDEAVGETQDESKEEPERRERDTSLDAELDFTRYDIEDMTGMDFFDIE